MGAVRRFFARCAALLRPGHAEKEMQRELASYQAMAAGTPLRIREAQTAELHRDARSFVAVEQWMQDIRHAARGFWKSPRFSAVALLSLALGIGVNTAIFTLVNGVLMKRLPVGDPERIVQVKGSFKTFESSGFSYPVFRELSRQDQIFTDLVGYSGGSPKILDLDGVPQPVALSFVTGRYFSAFGGHPTLGRVLDEEDDRVDGARHICVLSHHAWQTYFRGDPQIVGRSIVIDGISLQVAGVANPDFVGGEMQRRFDLWAPTATFGEFGSSRDGPNMVWLRVLGRLRPGLSFAEANTRLQAASPSIEATLPKNRANPDPTYILREASKGTDSYRSQLSEPLLVLLGAVSLVLLVACANLANLLLARSSERQREFAIKVSLGISRWRLLRQLLVESVMLAVVGGAAGIAISLVLTRVLLKLYNGSSSIGGIQVSLDGRVLLFTSLACFGTALIAGIYPAWTASRTDAARGLRAGRQGVERNFVRRGLIVVQVTLAVVLLFGASLFTHSLHNLKTVDTGYNIGSIVTVRIGPRGATKGVKPQPPTPAFDELLARVRGLGGVAEAAYVQPAALSGSSMVTTVTVTDRSGQTRSSENVHVMFAGPGLLSTMGIPLVGGRDLTTADRPGSPPVALVNEKLAAELWPGQNPVGQHCNGFTGKEQLEVVGLVKNSKYRDVRETTQAILYQSFQQSPVRQAAIEVRARGAFPQLERDVRAIVKESMPNYQVSGVTAMELLRDDLIAQDRLLAFLANLFGTLGTVLAVVGIYGLISYSVARRQREIGIRMSIGAQRSTVLWMFLREAATLVVIGMLVGTPLALVLARFLQKLLYEVGTSDLPSIYATIALLAVTGLAASFVPARKATLVNPVEALRCD